MCEGMRESGKRGEEMRDSSSAVPYSVLVLRCRIPEHQAWPCLR